MDLYLHKKEKITKIDREISINALQFIPLAHKLHWTKKLCKSITISSEFTKGFHTTTEVKDATNYEYTAPKKN